MVYFCLVDRNVERERKNGIEKCNWTCKFITAVKPDYVKRKLIAIYSHSGSSMSISEASAHRKCITDVSVSLTLLRPVNGVSSDMTDGVNPERIWIIKIQIKNKIKYHPFVKHLIIWTIKKLWIKRTFFPLFEKKNIVHCYVMLTN